MSEFAARPLPRRLLIANRGEIACRIIRTARRLGIETIAVHSDADRNARHVRLADRALRIGPAAARDSYLNIEALLAAATRSGADAVHPGYGFLSENADFASACVAAGLVFIGPPASAIRAMGSKSEAKRLLEGAGVPLTPGYHGELQDDATLLREANGLGYPLLIKASAGGGGKGIRRVDHAAEFPAALAACQREALASFADPRVLLERCIQKPRHIELQIFADQHGNAIHLGERDCSIQRRHQKVLEEAPAPGMTVERRAAMGHAAVNAALRVGYVGAGTVEFIVEPDGTFYFMEMNTRLQVEHPVTELITGFDLVEWQLRIAAGEALPIAQNELQLTGHAIEVRLYAEDPSRGFLPSPGRILHCEMPDDLQGVRVDAGIESGDEISPYYDAMIAKLIVHGSDRGHALARLESALKQIFLVGPRNNLEFLSRLLRTRSLQQADLDTHLIERENEWLSAASPPLPESLWLAALAALLLKDNATGSDASPSTSSPWQSRDGFRLAGKYQRRIALEAGAERRDLVVIYSSVGWQVVMERTIELRACPTVDGRIALLIDDSSSYARAFIDGTRVHVQHEGRQATVHFIDVYAAASGSDAPRGGLRSPMPGRVVAVHVKAGDQVERGAPLLAIEAMKMEHVITAPTAGVIEAMHVTLGAQVAEDVALVDFRAE